MGDQYRHIYYQQRLVYGDFLYDNTRLERLYNANNLNTTFLHSIYTEEHEKPMIEQAMQKQVMNGSVVPLLEKPKHDEIKADLKKWFSTFYNGEKLTRYEKDLESQYLLVKFQKNKQYHRKALLQRLYFSFGPFWIDSTL